MIYEIVLAIGGVFGTVVTGVGGWVFKMIFADLKDMRSQHDTMKEEIAGTNSRLDQHRLHVAETYTTKSDLGKMETNLVDHLLRIESKLDTKQDKK